MGTIDEKAFLSDGLFIKRRYRCFLYVMNVDNTPYTFEVFKTALENDGILRI